MIADPAFAQMIGSAAMAFVELAPAIIELIPSLVDLAIVLIPMLIEGIPILIPLVSFLSDLFKNIAPFIQTMNDAVSDTSKFFFRLSPITGLIAMGIEWLSKTFGNLGLGIASIFSPIVRLIGFFTNFEQVIKNAFRAYNEFIGFITGNPVSDNVVSGGFPMSANTRVMPFASGGIVTSPMMGLVGEAGPEAIIPLDRLGSMGYGGGGVTVNVNTVAGDPVAIERVVLDAISRASRRGTTRLAV
jgi:hypothetical protein